MKNFIAFLCLLSVVVYWNGGSTYAQSKGGSSQGPSLNHGHSQDGTPDKVKAHQAKADWETKFNERMQNDAAFRSRIQSLLPPGTDLKTAENGFRNHGQFIAALHVSKNLNIPFDQLKAKMTGVSTTSSTVQTSSTAVSLGKAIHALRPGISANQANEEAKRAEKQATVTMKATTAT
jgi:hypothetical protein